LVLFDIDGTLIRTHGAGVRAFEQTAAKHFGLVDGIRKLQFAGRTDSSLIRELLTHHGVPVTPENAIRFHEYYLFLLDAYLEHSTGGPCPGVLKFLGDLQTLAHPPLIGLLTGNIRLGAEIKLRRFGLWGRFEMGAFGDDHEDRNELARIALARGRARLGGTLTGEEVLVIGDTPHDIQCGRAIGARVLAVGTGGASLEQLQVHEPDWMVADLEGFDVRELAGPLPPRPLNSQELRLAKQP